MYYKTVKSLNLVIKITLVFITVLEVMFIHGQCLMEAKDVCSRASGKVKTYLIPPHCFVIFFEHCTFCTIVIKGTFLAIIWFCKRQLRICQVESMTPEYPLLEFLFITPNNSTQIQNVCMEIYWYTFCHLSLSLHKTQS